MTAQSELESQHQAQADVIVVDDEDLPVGLAGNAVRPVANPNINLAADWGGNLQEAEEEKGEPDEVDEETKK